MRRWGCLQGLRRSITSFKIRLSTIARGVENNKMCHHGQPLKMRLHLEAKNIQETKKLALLFPRINTQ